MVEAARGALLAVGVGWAALASAPGAAPPGSGAPLRVDTLPNGLVVVVSEDRSTPVVAVSLWHDLRGPGLRPGPVGAGRDAGLPGRTALARLVQSVLAEGSERLGPGDLRRLVEGSGGTASASVEGGRASFRVVLPSRAFDLALWLHADRLRPLAVDPRTFPLHRRLLAEELTRPAVDDRARAVAALDSLLTGMRGTRSATPRRGVLEASEEGLRDFQRRWMGPSNATLVVVGDVDAEDAVERVGRHLGGAASSTVPESAEARGEASLPGDATVRLSRPGPALVALGFPVAAAGAAGAGGAAGMGGAAGPARPGGADGGDSPAGADGAALALFAGLVAWPGREVEGAAGGTVRAGLYEGGAAPLFVVSAGARPGVDADALEAALLEAIAGAAAGADAPGALEGARNRERAALAAAWLTVAGRAESLQRMRHAAGRPVSLAAAARALEAVTPEDLRRVAERWLAPERRLRVVVGGPTAEEGR